MTKLLSFSGIDNSNRNDTDTLKQGRKFKKYQSIFKNNTNSRKLIEGFTQRITEGLENNDSTNEINSLEKEYEDTLVKYNAVVENLNKSVGAYVGEKLDKTALTNVYVNNLVDNPTATYVGCYGDGTDRALTYAVESGKQAYSYDSCMKIAVDNNYRYFGLQNGSAGNSQCFLSNDINSVTKYGEANQYDSYSIWDSTQYAGSLGVFTKYYNAKYATLTSSGALVACDANDNVLWSTGGDPYCLNGGGLNPLDTNTTATYGGNCQGVNMGNVTNAVKSMINGFNTVMPLSAGKVILYSGENYTGKAIPLEFGDYPFQKILGTGYQNDTLNSIRVPNLVTVTLWEHDIGSGGSRVITSDTPSLAALGFGNTVSSLQMTSNDSSSYHTVTLYSGENYTGQAVKLPFSTSYSFNELLATGYKNDTLNSIKVPSGISVTLWEHDLGSGGSRYITSDTPSLAAIGFGNTVSSLQMAKVQTTVNNIERNSMMINLPVSNSTFGDPAPGCRKGFNILYGCGGVSYPGSEYQINLPYAENQFVKLDCTDFSSRVCNFRLLLQDDGNVCIYRIDGKTKQVMNGIWCSMTNGKQASPNKSWGASNSKFGRSYLDVGEKLFAEEWISSNDGSLLLKLQADGRISIWTSKAKIACQKGDDGKLYGTGWVNAVYQMDQLGKPGNMGKMGYLDENLKLSEYPTDMYNINPLSIKNNTGCSKIINNVDSLKWDTYNKSPEMMSPTTRCGLDALREQEQELRRKLIVISDKIVDRINCLNKKTGLMNNTMGNNKNTLDKNLEKYKEISAKYKSVKSSDITKANAILEDSQINNLGESYKYIIWGILALIIIIVAIRIVRGKFIGTIV